MRWRVIQNEWNLKAAPWRGAVGIEEDDETAYVPALICWFTRPNGQANAELVIEQHNKALER